LSLIKSDAAQSDPGGTKREVEILCQAGSHDNIVTLYDSGVFDGTEYLVLEFLPGGTLRDYLDKMGRQNRRVPVADVMTLGRQMTRAVSASDSGASDTSRLFGLPPPQPGRRRAGGHSAAVRGGQGGAAGRPAAGRPWAAGSRKRRGQGRRGKRRARTCVSSVDSGASLEDSIARLPQPAKRPRRSGSAEAQGREAVERNPAKVGPSNLALFFAK